MAARCPLCLAPRYGCDVVIVAAVLGLVGLLLRRSLLRAAIRGILFLLVVGAGVITAIVTAGPHWPWIAVAAALLLSAGLSWKLVCWARAVHAVTIAKVVWFGWQWVVDIWDARAVARASGRLPPRST